jgi:acyl carrier protein
MGEIEAIHERIRAIFSERLNVEPPPRDVDLLEIGLLDSLMFVSRLLHLEESVGVRIELHKLNLETFTSLDRIASFVVAAGGRGDA